MEKKDFFKDMYNDFFGIDSLLSRKKHLRDIDQIANYQILEEEEARKRAVYEQNESILEESEEVEFSKEEKDQHMKELFEQIEELYIDENSKKLLKKIIEYMRKYNEKIEEKYISFNMCVYSNNKETIQQILKIMLNAGALFSYVKQGQGAVFSLYDVDDSTQVKDIYKENNSVVLIQGFEGFNKQDDKFKERFINKFDEFICKNENEVLTILNSKSKETILEAFKNNQETIEKFLDFEIIGIEPDVDTVYLELLEKLKNSMPFSEENAKELFEYISVTYPRNTLSYPEYRKNIYEAVLFNKKVPDYEKEKGLDEVFKELNSLVGLTKVKQVLQDLVSLIELKDKVKDDLKIKNTNLHMVFLGNPGTGKTTVARIVAEMLYQLKYVKQNKLIEVSSKDLVAEYVGQTAPKTQAVIERAMGGVLFIDEAYSLATGDGQGNSFNEEAIATLIQAMENHREDFVVIFAGYTKEMQNFLNSNSGIVSRIGYTLEFEDYTEEELVEIFKSMINKAGFNITDEALDEALNIIKEYKDSENFGNARFVRNLYEKTVIKHASNTKGKDDKNVLKTIQKEDISVENLLK